MDPISTAILAAVSAGVTSGISSAGKQAVLDAYNGLKKIISSKYGKDSRVSKSIVELERDPESKKNQTFLLEQIAATKASFDIDIKNVALELTQTLNRIEAGRKAIAKFQVVTKGSYVGVIGDEAHIEGGIHFGDSKNETS